STIIEDAEPGLGGRWDTLHHIDYYLAEAAVAELVHRLGGDDTRWRGGNNRGWDVAGAGRHVDVKRAFVTSADLQDGDEPCLGFMGSTRRPQGQEARPGITYALTLVHHGANDDGPMTYVDRDVVRLDAQVAFTVFWFTDVEINTLFKRPRLKNGSGRRTGANLYFPMAQLVGATPWHHWQGVTVNEWGEPLSLPL
ncbi:hypothetical protein JS562_53190, partial [Agrobacterium sp. S2]|nr:hypothetical protein [Agrobacterium sp. S2]